MLFLADGIVLVVMALGAAGGEGQPGGRDRVRAVQGVLKEKLLVVDTTFTVGEGVAGGSQLRLSAPWWRREEGHRRFARW